MKVNGTRLAEKNSCLGVLPMQLPCFIFSPSGLCLSFCSSYFFGPVTRTRSLAVQTWKFIVRLSENNQWLWFVKSSRYCFAYQVHINTKRNSFEWWSSVCQCVLCDHALEHYLFGSSTSYKPPKGNHAAVYRRWREDARLLMKRWVSLEHH